MKRTFYCDGSTLKNGQIGQDSSVLVLKPDKTIFREHIGDYSINYAELWAIKRAAEFATGGEEIVTDSMLSFRWIRLPFRKTKDNIHLESLVIEIKQLVKEKRLELIFKLRAENKAGWEIEANPFYGENTHVQRLMTWKKKRLDLEFKEVHDRDTK
ncbi:MAG: RNase H family protein [Nitrospiria bacterium]